MIHQRIAAPQNLQGTEHIQPLCLLHQLCAAPFQRPVYAMFQAFPDVL